MVPAVLMVGEVLPSPQLIVTPDTVPKRGMSTVRPKAVLTVISMGWLNAASMAAASANPAELAIIVW